MAHFEFSSVIPAPREKVFQFMADVSNFSKLFPPEYKIEFGSPLDPMAKGKEYALRIGRYGVSVYWEAVIEDYNKGEFFRDRQKTGPFALWIHTHRFSDHAQGTLMTDIVEYELPFGVLGKLTEDLILTKEIKKLFQFREKTVSTLLRESKSTNKPESSPEGQPGKV